MYTWMNDIQFMCIQHRDVIKIVKFAFLTIFSFFSLFSGKKKCRIERKSPVGAFGVAGSASMSQCWQQTIFGRKHSRSQGQGHYIVNVEAIWKILTRWMSIANMNALPYTDQRFTGKVKICGQMFRQTDRKTESLFPAPPRTRSRSKTSIGLVTGNTQHFLCRPYVVMRCTRP